MVCVRYSLIFAWVVENIELKGHKARLMGVFETIIITISIPLVMFQGYLMRNVDLQYFFGFYAILHLISLSILLFTKEKYPVKKKRKNENI